MAAGAAERKTPLQADVVSPEVAAVLDLAPDAIVVADMEGRIRYVNAATCSTFGHRRRALIGQPVEMLMPGRFRAAHPDHRRDFMSHARTRPMGAGEQLKALHADGREIPVDIQLSPMPHAAGPLVMASLRDVTERAAMEERLRTFTAFASHDLKAPLRRMQWIVAATPTDATIDELRRRMGAMAEHTRRMQALVDALMDYERLATREAAGEQVALTPLFLDVTEVLGNTFSESGTRIEVGALPTVRGDATLLRSVVQNLLHNALRYRHPERPLTVTVSGHVQDGKGHVAVMDNGRGFATNQAEAIFDMFQRLDADDHGSGIGLASCRRVIENMGGTIWAEGEPGIGAVFRFELPAATQRPASSQ